eukprot:jgi/Undpi1/12843/HiC_scaffold_7.g02510.m1
MVTNMQEDWSITRVEIADGLYPSVCATLQVTYDHLAVGVVASFSTIGVLHAIYWQRFISEIPAHWLGVNIQLSCMATLVAWIMIALFDVLAISGLPLSLAHAIGVVVDIGITLFGSTSDRDSPLSPTHTIGVPSIVSEVSHLL